MNSFRRADSEQSSSHSRGVFAAVMLLCAAIAALLVFLISVARRVVTPREQTPDTKIMDLDVRSQTIMLQRNAETELPGRYGLVTNGTLPYLKIGSVLSINDMTVTRKLLTEVDGNMLFDDRARFSGYYFDDPEQLRIPYSSELIDAPVGSCPAWVFPGDHTWVIQIHGRGTSRAEVLRAVPVFHDLGFTTMAVSYRNDGEAPVSRSQKYGLGSTEWQDIDAAISYAKANGASRIVLMGWSMGGAIALQVAEQSVFKNLITGMILESPVVSWRNVLQFQSELNRMPRKIGDLAYATLQSQWGARAVGTDPIPFDALDILSKTESLQVPTLILHSDDDDFVPADGSYALAEARPDLVKIDTFTTAHHAKLWNYDQPKWEQSIREWVQENLIQ